MSTRGFEGRADFDHGDPARPGADDAFAAALPADAGGERGPCVLIVTPTRHAFVAGTSEGPTALNAFDGALLAAGIGNTNLMKMSSIVPPSTVEAPVADLQCPPGALVPVAYAAKTSAESGALISAAVAAAWTVDPERPGVIMEFSGFCSREEAEGTARHMAEEALRMRGWPVGHVRSAACEHRVETHGAAFAAVVLWR